MVRYDYQKSIRMSNEVKDSLEKICEVYKVNESDYIRLSLEKTLYADMRTKGLQPTFSTLYQQTAQDIKKGLIKYGSLVSLICNV